MKRSTSHAKVPHSVPRETILLLGLLYLALPAMAFAIGFLNPWVAVALCLFGMAAMVGVMLRATAMQIAAGPAIIALVSAAIVLAVTGFPNGPFTWDWIKHWALINTLTNRPWPVTENFGGMTNHIRFYVGAYIAPALLRKGIPSIGPVLAFGSWIFIGAFLVFYTVCAAGGTWLRSAIAAGSLFLLGGADAYADHLWRMLRGLSTTPWLGIHYETWTMSAFGLPLEFSSMVTLFQWVPHQCLATFLVTASLLYGAGRNGFAAAMLSFGFLSVWSPYGLLGLCPLVLYCTWRHRFCLFSPLVLLCVAAGAAMAMSVAAFLSTQMPEGGMCFSCLLSHLSQWPYMVCFLAFETIAYALILRGRIVSDPVCCLSLAVLATLPFLYGKYPDLVMRGSMGPLFTLVLRSTEAITAQKVSTLARMCQASAIALCAPTAISEITYVKTAGAVQRALPPNDPLHTKWMTTFATRTDYRPVEFFEICGWEFLPQYYSTVAPRLSK